MRIVPRERRKSLFQCRRSGLGFQRRGCSYCGKITFLQYRHPLRQQLNFRKAVRSKQQGGALSAQHFAFQELPKISSGKRVQAPCGLIEEQHFGLVDQCSEKTEALNRT